MKNSGKPMCQFQSAPRLVAAENAWTWAQAQAQMMFQSAPRLVAAENG